MRRSSEKSSELISKILQRTVEGSLSWEKGLDDRAFQVRIGDFSIRIWEITFAGSSFQYMSTDHLSRPYSEQYTNNSLHGAGLMTGGVFARERHRARNALMGVVDNDLVRELDPLTGQKLKELYDIVSGRDNELDELLNLLE